ncbi:cytochrome P450 family protein [Amycolatopsis keratiniphila]|uniref:cytochrome P450 family protein n=1 Tax=Amycolatopsis keratiniphila TaxID=129921 RepID=UPI00087AE9D7|nr:cytochrome P450 [Amycolatopsis keratiniphila]OLZ61015.1 cytochrome [Amycolatopsis keratiniphila subsp. nogabecina]SDT97987.1 Cytochrome P450 [Amycolatopsis keratiniphila]
MGEPKNLDWDLVQDPHRVSALLREEGPARKVRLPRGLDVWIVTGYAEARAILSDSRVAKDPEAIRRLFERDGFESAADNAVRALGAHMLNSDPPDHTRLRKLVNQAFTSRTVSRLRPRIEQITAELLDGIGDAERIDLLPAFAVPLPIRVICELLGVHAGDQPAFATWSNTMVAWSTPEELQAAAAKMHAYLVDLIEEKRAEPAEDLLSALIHASDEGDSLTADELLAMAFLLLVAGFETTVNLIANSVLALLREPDQLAALRADPALIPGAVEEFLRYDGAIHLATIRFTKEAVPVGDVEIPAGEFVLVSLLGANRDAGRFEDPDRLDVTRSASGHLAFGHGIHYCVGAPLARLEAEIALRGLLGRFPVLGLDAEPEALRWRESTLVHGLETLPVLLR